MPKIFNKSTKLALIILVVAISFTYALIKFRPTQLSPPLSERAWRVFVVTAEKKDYRPSLVLYGNVETPRTSEMKAAIATHVLATPALEGAQVKKNQLLVALDPYEAKLLVTQREGEVEDLKAAIQREIVRAKSDKSSLTHDKALSDIKKRFIKRQEYLFKRKVGSEENVDKSKEAFRQQQLSVITRQMAVDDAPNRLAQLQARLKKADALLDQAKLDVKRAEIRAPFNGRVSALHVAVGDWVQKGESLIDVFDTSALEVRAQVPDEYVPGIITALQKNQKIIAIIESEGNTIQLKLDRLSGKVAAGRGGVDGLFNISASGEWLALGRTLEIDVGLPPIKNSFALPNEALYGTNRVYRVVDNRLEAVAVKRLGFIHTKGKVDKVIVTSDALKTGDAILSTQLPNARSGLLVNIVKPSEA